LKYVTVHILVVQTGNEFWATEREVRERLS
jgi:hypothetical protein